MKKLLLVGIVLILSLSCSHFKDSDVGLLTPEKTVVTYYDGFKKSDFGFQKRTVVSWYEDIAEQRFNIVNPILRNYEIIKIRKAEDRKDDTFHLPESDIQIIVKEIDRDSRESINSIVLREFDGKWLILGIDVVEDPPGTKVIDEQANDCEGDLGKWLTCNNPRLIQYLEKLSPNDVGTDLKGVNLTDGRNVLGGHRYLGEAKGLGKGVHLYVFEYKGRKLAFLWIDHKGNELSLPSCPDLPYEDIYESSYVLSGDVYTSSIAQPGHGVIQVMCVKDSWLKAIKKETRP